MPERPSNRPPSPEPKRNTTYGHDSKALKEANAPATSDQGSGKDRGKPDEGLRPDQLTTESDDGQG